ncbi:sodium/panthothenate symporter [Clostridia bacterium]|nr:sodium/panthothenate symporter [Clostridia bacterium]
MGKAVGIFVAVYFVVIILISVIANKKTVEKTTGDFYVASNSLGPVLIFCAAFATAFSAFSFMGQMGQVFVQGSSAIFNYMTYSFFAWPPALLIGKRIWYFGKKYGYVTPADMLVHRYQSNTPMRIIIGLFVCVYCSVFYIVININGTAWALETVTGMNPIMAKALVCIVLAIYVNIGGFRGAAYVDAMQFVFIMLGVIVLAFAAIHVNGGFSELYMRLDEVNPSMWLPKQPFITMFTGSITMCVSIIVWPTIWTRCYAAKSLRANWAVSVGMGSGTVVVTVGTPLIIVAGIMIAYANQDPSRADTFVIRYAMESVNPVIAVIVIGGLVSAALSTAASLTLLGSSVFTKDLPKCFPSFAEKTNDKNLLVMGRVINVVIIFICFLVSLRPMGSLIQAGISFTYPGYFLTFPIVVGGFFWKRANKEGAIAGLLVGIATIITTTYIVPTPFGIATGIWGVAMCTIAFILVSLNTPPTGQKTLEQFGLIKSKKEGA